MHFVVVDNNKKDLDVLVGIITTAVPECKVQPFTDPLFSAKYICNTQVDIVFIADAMRPVNGFRLLQVLRKNIPKLTVVMLSKDNKNRIEAIQAGVSEYMLKPISADLLGSVVKQLAVV